MQAEAFVTYTVENHAKPRSVDLNGIANQALLAEFKMVANFSQTG